MQLRKIFDILFEIYQWKTHSLEITLRTNVYKGGDPMKFLRHYTNVAQYPKHLRGGAANNVTCTELELIRITEVQSERWVDVASVERINTCFKYIYKKEKINILTYIKDESLTRTDIFNIIFLVSNKKKYFKTAIFRRWV